MKIGSCMTDVSPKGQASLTGFGNPNRKFLGIHDPIYVTATVIENNGCKVCFVTGDALGFDHGKLSAVRAEIAAKAGIAPDHILFNASHTHSAPRVLDVLNDGVGEYIAEYSDFFYAAVVESVVNANEDLEEGELFWNTIDCYGVGVNRRQTKNGKYVGGPDEDGIRNDEVTVLKAVCGDKIKAILFNFACHPSTIGFDYASADYPGVARRILKEKYGCVPAFLQGTCGDIRVRTTHDSGHFWRGGTYDDIERFGTMLAARVEEALSRPMQKVEGKLSSEISVFTLPLLEKAPLAEYEAKANDEKLIPYLRIGYRYYADNYDSLPTERIYSVQRIDLGDKLSFWALEGEVCTGYDLNIKAMQPDRHAAVCGYSNGMPGYIFTEDMFPIGGYEPIDSAICFLLVGGFRPEIERVILKECEKLAK